METGVPCSMAVQLLRVCNEQADDIMAQQFYHYYDTWKLCDNVTHLGIYYNTHIKNCLHQWLQSKSNGNCGLSLS